jgi:hypothetical protein
VTLSTELHALGEPLLEVQLAHPFLRGIADGTLDPAVFRAWLEQDHLFLLGYTRVFSRLAWRAPAEHLGELVALANSTFHDELGLHRGIGHPCRHGPQASVLRRPVSGTRPPRRADGRAGALHRPPRYRVRARLGEGGRHSTRVSAPSWPTTRPTEENLP